jgi:hypothetical protein
MVAPGLNYYYVSDVKQQWKEVADYLMEIAEPDEVIVFAPNWGNIIQQRSFDWYYQDSFRACGLGDENGLIDTDEIDEELYKCVSGQDRFWVIVSDQSEDVDHFEVFFQNPNPKFMRLVEERFFYSDIMVYLFEKVD